MLWRFTSFFLTQLAAAWIGWLFGGVALCVLVVIFAGSLWLALDFWRSRRLLQWLRDPESHPSPVMRGVWGDVADRCRRYFRLRDQQLLTSENRLKAFLSAIQASPNGVVLLDTHGHIEWCNQTAAGHFGFDPQRDLMHPISNLVRDPTFVAYYVGNDYSHEVIMLGRNSSPSQPVRLSVQLHPYGDGHRLLLSRDVTALAQAEAMRRDFVANVSHEIRTPLTVLSGFIETMQTLPFEAKERKRYLSLMGSQADRMQTLVNDLLTLSRLEGSPPPGSAEWVSAHDLTAQCEQEGVALSSILFPPPAAPQTLNFHEAPNLAVAGAANELRSALSNLVNNAVRYTPAGGQIDVLWQVLPDGRAVFSVTDTGPGISAEHLPRLSERFYRVDRSRSRESGGTGLGLAIAKHVAQRHGGELRISSTLGKGSRFAVVFPSSRVKTVMARDLPSVIRSSDIH
jgi:two-component system phosphate regulon sensor histidine kinase PhoR